MRAIELVERVKRLPVVRPALMRRYERFFASATGHQLFRGVFGSFDEAARSAPHTKPLGYDGDGSAAMYRDHVDALFPTDYPALFWLSRILPAARSLIDFGGHVGVKFYAYGRHVGLPPDLTWTVCDVPAVARAGETLAAERGASRLAFVTDLAAARPADVLFCCGSLQYVERSPADLVRSMRRPPEHIVINSTPITERPTFVTLNSIGTAFCPYVIRERAELLRDLAVLGYELVDEWQHPGKTCEIPFHRDWSLEAYRGLYLRRTAKAE